MAFKQFLRWRGLGKPLLQWHSQKTSWHGKAGGFMQRSMVMVNMGLGKNSSGDDEEVLYN
jgi:hypothetical protein